MLHPSTSTWSIRMSSGFSSASPSIAAIRQSRSGSTVMMPTSGSSRPRAADLAQRTAGFDAHHPFGVVDRLDQGLARVLVAQLAESPADHGAGGDRLPALLQLGDQDAAPPRPSAPRCRSSWAKRACIGEETDVRVGVSRGPAQEARRRGPDVPRAHPAAPWRARPRVEAARASQPKSRRVGSVSSMTVRPHPTIRVGIVRSRLNRGRSPLPWRSRWCRDSRATPHLSRKRRDGQDQTRDPPERIRPRRTRVAWRPRPAAHYDERNPRGASPAVPAAEGIDPCRRA